MGAIVPVSPLERNGDAIARVPRSLAFKCDVLPLNFFREGLDDVLVLGTTEPRRFEHRHLDSNGRQIALSRRYDDAGVSVECPNHDVHRVHVQLRRASQCDRLDFVAIPASDLRRLQQAWYGPPRMKKASAIEEQVETMLEDAVLEHAHDIKIEPMNPRSGPAGRIRFFVLGRGIVYRTVQRLDEFEAFLAVIKGRAVGMDITKKRIQQDGRMSFVLPHREVALRLSTFPTRRVDPETITGRVLDLHLTVMPPLALGMRPHHERQVQAAVHMNGALAVAGAPGAGKSTTAETLSSLRNDEATSVVAIGDPVETPQYGELQVEVDEINGLTPLGILKGMTRHYPQFGNAGECRDPEYTALAFDLAGIRPMVLTVHADGALDAFYEFSHRLKLDVETIERRLHTVVGQHLVGRLCRECRQPIEVPDFLRALRPNAPGPVYEAVGCAFCHGGFARRFAVFEILEVSKEMRRALARHESQIVLEEIAAREGFRPMLEDAIDRVFEGETAVSELFGVPGWHERMREMASGAQGDNGAAGAAS
jgi:type II secretory ATPase GspE/PulE/Tfp pilus assembly ATPase PilB-like protein